MKIEYSTTRNAFVFGFSGTPTYDEKNFAISIILGFLVINFTWKHSI